MKQALQVYQLSQVNRTLSLSVPGEDTNELDLIQLAPKKPDWDLKRAIQPRLDRLNKKTERAIAELIRERLKGSADLAAQVAAAGPDVDFVD